MIITLICLVFQKEPKLPFRVNTIGGILCYLSSSSLLKRWNGLVFLDTRRRNERIREMGGRYGIWRGEVEGMEGTPVVVIDVERNTGS